MRFIRHIQNFTSIHVSKTVFVVAFDSISIRPIVAFGDPSLDLRPLPVPCDADARVDVPDAAGHGPGLAATGVITRLRKQTCARI